MSDVDPHILNYFARYQIRAPETYRLCRPQDPSANLIRRLTALVEKGELIRVGEGAGTRYISDRRASQAQNCRTTDNRTSLSGLRSRTSARDYSRSRRTSGAIARIHSGDRPNRRCGDDPSANGKPASGPVSALGRVVERH